MSWRSALEHDLETLSYVKRRLAEVEAENVKLRLNRFGNGMLDIERRRLMDEVAGIDGERRSLAKEAEGWRLRCYESEREKAVWENRVGELTLALTEAKDRQAVAESGQAEAKTEVLDLRQKVATLEAQLQESESKRLSLEVQLHDLGKDLRELQQRAAASDVLEERLRRENDDITSVLRKSEEQCKTLHERNVDLVLSLDRSSGHNASQRKQVEHLEDANRRLRLGLQDEISKSFLEKDLFPKDPEYVESVVVRSPSTGRRRHLVCDETLDVYPYEWPISPSERARSRLDYPRRPRSWIFRDEVLRSRQLADRPLSARATSPWGKSIT